MTNKIQEIRNALDELDKAINDVKKKYGDSVDTKFLKDKFEELLRNLKNND